MEYEGALMFFSVCVLILGGFQAVNDMLGLLIVRYVFHYRR